MINNYKFPHKTKMATVFDLASTNREEIEPTLKGFQRKGTEL